MSIIINSIEDLLNIDDFTRLVLNTDIDLTGEYGEKFSSIDIDNKIFDGNGRTIKMCTNKALFKGKNITIRNLYVDGCGSITSSNILIMDPDEVDDILTIDIHNVHISNFIVDGGAVFANCVDGNSSIDCSSSDVTVIDSGGFVNKVSGALFIISRSIFTGTLKKNSSGFIHTVENSRIEFTDCAVSTTLNIESAGFINTAISCWSTNFDINERYHEFNDIDQVDQLNCCIYFACCFFCFKKDGKQSGNNTAAFIRSLYNVNLQMENFYSIIGACERGSRTAGVVGNIDNSIGQNTIRLSQFYIYGIDCNEHGECYAVTYANCDVKIIMETFHIVLCDTFSTYGPCDFEMAYGNATISTIKSIDNSDNTGISEMFIDVDTLQEIENNNEIDKLPMLRSFTTGYWDGTYKLSSIVPKLRKVQTMILKSNMNIRTINRGEYKLIPPTNIVTLYRDDQITIDARFNYLPKRASLRYVNSLFKDCDFDKYNSLSYKSRDYIFLKYVQIKYIDMYYIFDLQTLKSVEANGHSLEEKNLKPIELNDNCMKISELVKSNISSNFEPSTQFYKRTAEIGPIKIHMISDMKPYCSSGIEIEKHVFSESSGLLIEPINDKDIEKNDKSS